MFKLVIQDDEGKTTVVPLIRDEITIGRKEGNTIRLTERNVSRRHARIVRNNGEVQIEDLGSYNGIRVNNARIAERVSLRVSDQVQIGDYKLYLKAEGVEQADEASTMPIQRVDNAPTDVMAAVPPPAQPLGVATATPVPGTLVGNPNRTLVSIADTDPHGRPVATPAQVAVLAAPTGYGKLVVLSSNFAGKEFELSRSQMIIGRTDENDIVVNHRSISRNHAKIVREPDTGRYTISDLQSSNGVRVNGQDYGKVELRRGDVIDLGHVRLRFVEPNEDFVFARDAVITDVPESGSRRGLLVAVILSVLVLVGVGAFYMMRDKGEPKKELGGTGPTGSQGSVPGETPDAAVAMNPPETPDAAEATAPPQTPDAATVVKPPDAKDEVYIECLQHENDQKWNDLQSCAARLTATKPAEAKRLRDRAAMETQAAVKADFVDNALRDKNLKKAKQELDQISPNASTYQQTKRKYDAAEQAAIDELVAKLSAAKEEDCKKYNQLLAQEASAKPSRVASEARKQVGCRPQTPTAPSSCDAEAFLDKGLQAHGAGQYAAAMDAFDKAWACKQDPLYAEKAFIPACNTNNVGKARVYWKRMSQAMRQRALMICVRNGISEEALNQ